MSMLYICYTDFADLSSGSKVRPFRMYQAFRQLEPEVHLLNGSQAREKRQERKRRVRDVLTWLRCNRPDYCYIESPSYPILYREDYRLIKELIKRRIPTAYFYRDMYHLNQDFNRPQDQPQGLIGKLKHFLLKRLYAKTDRVIGGLDLIYFPSDSMAEFFDYSHKRALMPAGENHLLTAPAAAADDSAAVVPDRAHPHTAIYVGGVSYAYATDRLLTAFARVVERIPDARLILVCRADEWLSEPDLPYRDAPWLDIRQASGAGLEPLYREASIALMPKSDSTYSDFSISVKLFEYLGFGLPVVAMDCYEMAQLIRRDDLGVVTGHDAIDFARGMIELMSDPALASRKQASVRQALLRHHLWIHRASQVKRDLLAVDAGTSSEGFVGRQPASETEERKECLHD